MDSVILARWSHRTADDSCATIVPDGCRDLILQRSPGGRPRWFLSPLDERSRHVQVAAGTIMRGFRLRPGVRIDERALLALTQTPRFQEGDLSECIRDFSVLSTPVAEALACLASEARTVRAAAVLLGITPRTLQRLLMHETGRPPSFWARLARARRAGRALLCGHALSDVAFEQGFADQAHMTREFRRWFGLTPLKARHETRFQSALQQAGHG